MWDLHYQDVTRAPAAIVWSYYEATDVAPKWDSLVAKITSGRGLVVGGVGINTSTTGFRSKWTLTEVVRNVGYTEVNRVPLATLSFTHQLTALPNGKTQISHGVECDGIGCPLYAILLRKDLEREMPRALRRLAVLAQNGTPQVTLSAREARSAGDPRGLASTPAR